ncbi:cupin domain-containing protein [Planomicrobium chinense]|uniref:cupin domain-containing protein n=1 Tax=Planococcus chinensis TaxID=272917 RepID=UPI001CC52582|nr:cupin domain-containing protein [Planococcus chinensis]MBZ5203075.1 cupin domain-containing protein [Planococcus chinensis]
MKVYSFSKEAGRRITKFDSNFTLARIAKADSEAHIGFMFLEPGETIGFHQATVSQLFIVTEGEGSVKTGDQEPLKLKAGQAILWKTGEWHGASTEQGMTALVIESESLMPLDLATIN